jgi:hypothetical protein
MPQRKADVTGWLRQSSPRERSEAVCRAYSGSSSDLVGRPRGIVLMQVIAESTDLRFLTEVKRELKT